MNMKTKTELLRMGIKELEGFMDSIGEPRYRGRQVHKWIYKKAVSSFYDMSDLSRDLRTKLDELARISIPRVLKQRASIDGTRKFLMELEDKKRIESVIIPHSRNKDTRYTLCISTQVGCPVGCVFCATGNSGFQRNLEAYEMIGQVLGSERELRKRLKSNENGLITNVVYMGMGEPMLNYDQVIKSIYSLNDPKGINIGQRHITISTSGDVRGINRLAQENLQVTLAISLHACSNELRDRLIPLNRKYPLEELIKSIKQYIRLTNRRVTFEYLLLDGVNNRKEDAEKLITMLKPLLANVNLIPYNEVEGLEFKQPSPQQVNEFYHYLLQAGVNVTLREEKGADIEAACGQLRAGYRK
ncbi:MAG TPA: 23S rRNA (adenine(2503)-C(2))-methyltransferase RlmN [Syntrophomonas sp.]|nr:23S rRNA (adenine(2503)-C(2))-methyltransferase RlmN [Syntrophomonas sp.]